MKKILIGTALGLILGISGSALAITGGGLVKFYPDVDYTAYYADHLNAMTLAGVVSGYNNGNFGPNDAVTRAQAVTMLDQYANKVVEQKIEEKFDAFLPMLQGLTLMGYPNVSYAEGVELAKAGLYMLKNDPDLKDYAKLNLGNDLPANWEIYQFTGAKDGPPLFYLKFTGDQPYPGPGPVGTYGPVPGWYGPFGFKGTVNVL